MQASEFQGVNYVRGQVKLFGTKLQVYVYAVDGMLVDSGPARLQPEIATFCEQQGLKKIVHTHFHEDHTGNTAYLAERFSVPAYLPGAALGICKNKAKIPFYRQLFWGARQGFDAQALPQFVENERSKFEVIPTPGHTQDHVCLLDQENGRLFTGDLFVHVKTRVIMGQENLPQLMDSLRYLLKREFETVYCSHAGVVKNGHRQIAQKLTNLEELQDKIQGMHQSGMGYKEINRTLFPITPFITRTSMGEWSSYHIVRSLIEDR
jgi:endoribonuclease LACTB2